MDEYSVNSAPCETNQHAKEKHANNKYLLGLEITTKAIIIKPLNKAASELGLACGNTCNETVRVLGTHRTWAAG